MRKGRGERGTLGWFRGGEGVTEWLGFQTIVQV